MNLRAILLSNLLIVLTAIGSQAQAWELSDVSVLLPLPKNIQQISRLLSIRDAGPLGPLMPQRMVDRLPALSDKLEKQKTYLDLTRLIGIRFDPCFFEGMGPVVCRRQVRMIWQPIVSVKGKITTIDAALHTFYEFSEPDWNLLIQKYRTLLMNTPVAKPETALTINPRISIQGFEDSFYNNLIQLLLENCGEKNFVRATVMTLGVDDNEWKFMGFDANSNSIIPILIATVGQPVQVLKTKKPVGFDLRATLMPNVFSKIANDVYADSLVARKKYNDAELHTVAEDIVRIENPGLNNPGTVDCARCHMAEPGAEWARLNIPKLNWQALVLQSGWQSARNLRNLTSVALKPRRFRAFGYFGSEPLFSQRTINESAVVADELDHTLPTH